MKRLVLALATFALLIVLALPGCRGTGEKTSVTADEVVQAAIKALARLDTYQFDSDYLDSVVAGEIRTMVRMSVSGAVDEAGKKMHQTVQINVEQAGSSSQTIIDQTKIEMYLIDGWVYMLETSEAAPKASTWDKSQFSDDYWQEQSAARQQLNLLTELAPVKLTGTETAGGV